MALLVELCKQIYCVAWLTRFEQTKLRVSLARALHQSPWHTLMDLDKAYLVSLSSIIAGEIDFTVYARRDSSASQADIFHITMPIEEKMVASAWLRACFYYQIQNKLGRLH